MLRMPCSVVVCRRYITADRKNEVLRKLATVTNPKSITPSMDVIEGTITVDGAEGEGGGQIIRNAISYANILRKPVYIHSIRAGRLRPGLREQHLRSIQLATEICGGILQCDKLNSSELYYEPATLKDIPDETKERTITGTVQTAGSISLLLQTALPCALFSRTPVRLYVKGGTNVTMAPQYEYWENVFLPTLVQQCRFRPNQIEPAVLKHGYYPKGGGIVKVQVQPIESRLRPITLMYRGKLKQVVIHSFYSGEFTQSHARRSANEAMLFLRSRIPNFVCQTSVEHYEESVGDGAGLLIIASFDCGRLLAGSSLAKHKKEKAKLLGVAAAEDLYRSYSDGGCVDEWLQDQLILYAALADGISEISTGSLTLHTKTAMAIAEQMVGAKFEILKIDHLGNASTTVYSPDSFGKKGRIPGKHLIRCHGIGFQRKTLV